MRAGMFLAVKQRLIFLYTGITGAILTIVVIMAFFASLWMEKRGELELFQESFNSCLNTIRQEAIISNMWFYEQEKRAVIEIWDNGRSLSVQGIEETEEREKLLGICRKKAKEEAISPSMVLVSNPEVLSGTYEIAESWGNKYFGKVGVVKVKDGYRGLVFLKQYSWDWREKGWLILWLFLLDAAGIGALYVFNSFFIGQVLKPVEESRRQQAEFIAAVSHELRSPLAVMKANLSAVKKIPEKQEEFNRTMEKECQRMNGLVGDLLLLAAKDAGEWHMDNAPVDTEALLIEAYESWYPVFQTQGLKLKIRVSREEIPEVFGDKKRLLQIFSILLSNALRFSFEGDLVVLGGEINKRKKIVRLFVEDHGKGIPEEEREKIFERFYQGDKSRKEKGHFGLGLSIAKEIVSLHGGELFCEETQGGGATFSIYLPFLEIN